MAFDKLTKEQLIKMAEKNYISDWDWQHPVEVKDPSKYAYLIHLDNNGNELYREKFVGGNEMEKIYPDKNK